MKSKLIIRKIFGDIAVNYMQVDMSKSIASINKQD